MKRNSQNHKMVRFAKIFLRENHQFTFWSIRTGSCYPYFRTAFLMQLEYNLKAPKTEPMDTRISLHQDVDILLLLSWGVGNGDDHNYNKFTSSYVNGSKKEQRKFCKNFMKKGRTKLRSSTTGFHLPSELWDEKRGKVAKNQKYDEVNVNSLLSTILPWNVMFMSSHENFEFFLLERELLPQPTNTSTIKSQGRLPWEKLQIERVASHLHKQSNCSWGSKRNTCRPNLKGHVFSDVFGSPKGAR